MRQSVKLVIVIVLAPASKPYHKLAANSATVLATKRGNGFTNSAPRKILPLETHYSTNQANNCGPTEA